MLPVFSSPISHAMLCNGANKFCQDGNVTPSRGVVWGWCLFVNIQDVVECGQCHYASSYFLQIFRSTIISVPGKWLPITATGIK